MVPLLPAVPLFAGLTSAVPAAVERWWSVVLVAEQVEMLTLPKMKSLSSAENEDDERECAQTFLNVSHAPASTSPEAVRSTPISENVNGWTWTPELIEPAALSGFALRAASPPGRRPQQGSVFALKQVLAAGLGVLPVPVDLSIQT